MSSPESRLRFCADALSLAPDTVTLTKLFGQASARQYFRVEAQNKTWVLMSLPQGFSSPAEEITKLDDAAPKEFPFLNVGRYLKELDVLVPDVLAKDDQQGLILLEDLGNQSFETQIQNADGSFLSVYYQKLIEDLIELQTKTQEQPSENCVAFHRRFDTELLDWEFWHFAEYGIEDRLAHKLSDSEKQLFQSVSHEFSKMITAFPYGFTHRDFQSRNVMVHRFQYYLIDFQDALQGPLVYDLVALLRDSYITISPEISQGLVQFYQSSLPESHAYASCLQNIERDFHVVSLQRKLKDLGRFQYIQTVKGNPQFLEHIPQTIVYLKETLHYLRNSPVLNTKEETAFFDLVEEFLR